MQTLLRVLKHGLHPALGLAFILFWLFAEASRIGQAAFPGSPPVGWVPIVVIGVAIGVSRALPILALSIAGALLVAQMLFWSLRFDQTSWPAYLGLLLVALSAGHYGDRRLDRAALPSSAAAALGIGALLTLPLSAPAFSYGTLNGWGWEHPQLWASFAIWAGVILLLSLAAWTAGRLLRGDADPAAIFRRLASAAYPTLGVGYVLAWLPAAAYSGRPLLGWVPLLLVGVAIGTSRALPRTTLGLVGGTVLLQLLLAATGSGSYGPSYLSAYGALVLVGVTVVAVGDRATRRAALPLFVLYALGLAVLVQYAIVTPDVPFLFDIWTIPLVLLALATWFTGFGIRALLDRDRAERMRLKAEADLAESEAELLVATERDRIAQDVHDIMAHSLSVIVAQADGARFLDGKRPGATAGSLEAIAQSARESLLEVRMLIDSLSADPEGHSQPTLDDLAALQERLRQAGLTVTEQTIGEPKPLTAGQQLSVYRIVQEALTNALKHAGRRPSASLTLDWRGPGLALAVTSRGDGHPQQPPTTGGTRGITGMRERARLAGGWLTAGLDDSEADTFIVTAFIPDASALQSAEVLDAESSVG